MYYIVVGGGPFCFNLGFYFHPQADSKIVCVIYFLVVYWRFFCLFGAIFIQGTHGKVD